MHWRERSGTSLVIQWLRICLPKQGTQVQSLVQEDSTCHGEPKPMPYSYWAHSLMHHKHRSPRTLEPMFCNKKSHPIDICTPVFIEALFTIARTWKQPRCPSADEWIRKLWYICTMEYYSAIKKNAVESVLMRWMKLEPIIQSEVSQKEKHQYSILMHIYGI